ncbi:DUF5676 family membrane protein [Ideonella sp. YS5]|uniref:DUF5676 family membrane protein n=1 Tax=Ideonella sp. YS5 TaxID=3453714 RepID=UPI003EEDD32B
MSTLSLSLHDNTPASVALCTGVALSVTVAVLYSLCTLVWVAAPGPFLGFMNSLFHGMDFSPLLSTSAFSWPNFTQAMVVMAIWSFLAGTFFGWLRQRLGT